MSQTTEKARSALDAFADLKDAPGTDNALPAVLGPATLAVLSRSEIDAQIAKAGVTPRNLKQARQTARDLATLNGEVAAECIYVVPRDNKEIEGPSIRFAEILAYAFHNARVGARIIEEAYDHVTAQGVFSDIETNVVTTFEVQRRIVNKKGRRYSLDMIQTTANAACAIARRNAILQGIPKPLWGDIFNDVLRLARGSGGKNMDVKVDDALKAFGKLGVSPDRIYAKLGVAGFDGIGLDELHRLRGFYNALADGEATVEEIFPEPQRQDSATLDQFAGAKPKGPTGDSSGAPTETAAADPGAGSSSVPAPDLQLYRQCIDRILGAATDKQLPDVEDRVANLDGPVKEIWMTQPVDPAFVMDALQAGVKVARGELPVAVAKKYLEGRVP
jgi:hypothetical protein